MKPNALGFINHNLLLVEGNSLSEIKWALDICKPPWMLADVAEEILDIATHIIAALVDALAKE